MDTAMTYEAQNYAFISPYTVEYVRGGYVIYCLMKPVSYHASLAEAEQVLRSLGAQ